MEYHFKDYFGAEVKLSFRDTPFSKEPGHVLVLPVFQNQFVLTRHPKRGIEFPGGKVEDGETAAEAAVRELMEETGATAEMVKYIGQYQVSQDKDTRFVKSIYFARVSEISLDHSFTDTIETLLYEKLPKDYQRNESFSYIMKDDMMKRTLGQLEKLKLI